MDKQQFEIMVMDAVNDLPAEFRDRLENVDVMVKEWPSPEQLSKAKVQRGRSLLGLYEGVPLSRRGRAYRMALPDKITLFQKPIESRCRHIEELEQEIRVVLLHEIGHHFGMDEKWLQKIESEKTSRRSKGTP